MRHTRRLAGVARIERKDWGDGTPAADEIGISPSISPKFPVVSVPYGSLVPRALDGLLAAGRHISCDANSHGFMREIPQCWLTGQAAGVGAAVAANRGVQPREVDVGRGAGDPARAGRASERRRGGRGGLATPRRRSSDDSARPPELHLRHRQRVEAIGVGAEHDAVAVAGLDRQVGHVDRHRLAAARSPARAVEFTCGTRPNTQVAKRR